MLAHTWEVEAGGSSVQDELQLYTKFWVSLSYTGLVSNILITKTKTRTTEITMF